MRAFFIGNGPSLVPEDLDRLKGEVTFACNRINLIYPKTRWRPSHYIFVDRYGNPKWEAEWEFHVGLDLYDCWCHYDLADMLPEHPRKKPLHPKWTRHPGALYSATHIAASLGIDELYLLGCDMGYQADLRTHHIGNYEYSDSDPNHFDVSYATKDAYASEITARKAEGLMMASYWQTWTEHRVDIINCTRGGSDKLPFRRETLEDIL